MHNYAQLFRILQNLFICQQILLVLLQNCEFVLILSPSFYNNSMEIKLKVRKGENMDKLTIGDRIKEARKNQGFTQEKLAEILGVSVEFVGQIERGLKLPSMQVFIKLIEVLNVSADYLLRDSVSTGRLFGDNAIGQKIEKLKPKQKIALEALVDTYIQYLD